VQKELGMPTVVAIAAVVIMVLGIVAWRYFGRPSANVLDPQAQRKIDQQTAQEYQQYFHMQPGGGPSGQVPMRARVPQAGGR
jgi:hypothetical protein